MKKIMLISLFCLSQSSFLYSAAPKGLALLLYQSPVQLPVRSFVFDQASRDRIDLQLAEAARKAEEARLEQERLEREQREEAQRLEQERLKAEEARLAKLEQERLAAEAQARAEEEVERKAEEARLAAERLEKVEQLVKKNEEEKQEVLFSQINAALKQQQEEERKAKEARLAEATARIDTIFQTANKNSQSTKITDDQAEAILNEAADEIDKIIAQFEGSGLSVGDLQNLKEKSASANELRSYAFNNGLQIIGKNNDEMLKLFNEELGNEIDKRSLQEMLKLLEHYYFIMEKNAALFREKYSENKKQLEHDFKSAFLLKKQQFLIAFLEAMLKGKFPFDKNRFTEKYRADFNRLMAFCETHLNCEYKGEPCREAIGQFESDYTVFGTQYRDLREEYKCIIKWIEQKTELMNAEIKKLIRQINYEFREDTEYVLGARALQDVLHKRDTQKREAEAAGEKEKVRKLQWQSCFKIVAKCVESTGLPKIDYDQVCRQIMNITEQDVKQRIGDFLRDMKLDVEFKKHEKYLNEMWDKNKDGENYQMNSYLLYLFAIHISEKSVEDKKTQLLGALKTFNKPIDLGAGDEWA